MKLKDRIDLAKIKKQRLYKKTSVFFNEVLVPFFYLLTFWGQNIKFYYLFVLYFNIFLSVVHNDLWYELVRNNEIFSYHFIRTLFNNLQLFANHLISYVLLYELGKVVILLTQY